MTPHPVYADFTAIEYEGEGSTRAHVALTGYGTLASLAKQRLRLVEGMPLLLFEPNDIECEAIAHFDLSRKDPAGRPGEWVGLIADHRNIRDCTRGAESSREHPCIACGSNFAAQSFSAGRNYTERCTNCGASIMEPMAAPHRAT